MTKKKIQKVTKQDLKLDSQTIIKRLGKISGVGFGYNGNSVGLTIILSNENEKWAFEQFRGVIGLMTLPNEHWTEEERLVEFSKVMVYIDTLLIESKRQNINFLVGVPVEVTIDTEKTEMVSWRVLEEVL